MAHILCMNHQVHLVEDAVSKMVCILWLKRMYCYSSLLTMGGHMTMIKMSVNKVISTRLVIRRGEPPPQYKETANIIIDYYSYVYGQFKTRAADRRQQERMQALRMKHRGLWQAFFALFNGNIFDCNVIEFWTSDVQVDRDQVIAALVRATLSLIVNATMTRPEGGKWTKLGPALDWMGKNILIHEIGRLVAEEAFGKHEQQASQLVGDGITQQLNWHEVVGARVKCSLELMRDSREHIHVVMLMIVLKPVRYLTAWFLHRSSEYAAPDATPTLLELTSKAYSLAIVAMQFLASVATGIAFR